MKHFFVKFLLIGMMIFSLFQLSGCYHNEASKISEAEPSDSPLQQEETNVDEQNIQNKSNTIEDYISNFNHAIDTQSSGELSKLVSKDGFVLLRTFTSGFGTKGAEVSETIDSLKIPQNLEFNIVKDESPISLKTEFDSKNKKYSEMKIVNTNEDLNWESLIKPDILNTLGKIVDNDKDLGEETRVYILNGGGFCLAQFAGSGLQYSRWAAFEKIEKGYALRLIAIIN